MQRHPLAKMEENDNYLANSTNDYFSRLDFTANVMLTSRQKKPQNMFETMACRTYLDNLITEKLTCKVI